VKYDIGAYSKKPTKRGKDAIAKAPPFATRAPPEATPRQEATAWQAKGRNHEIKKFTKETPSVVEVRAFALASARGHGEASRHVEEFN